MSDDDKWRKRKIQKRIGIGNLGSIPGLRRSGGGHGNPLQYSSLENPHEQRSLAGYSPWGHKEQDTTDLLSTRKDHRQVIILNKSCPENMYRYHLFEQRPEEGEICGYADMSYAKIQRQEHVWCVQETTWKPSKLLRHKKWRKSSQRRSPQAMQNCFLFCLIHSCKNVHFYPETRKS